MFQSFVRMFTRFSFSGRPLSRQVVLVCLYQCIPLLEKLHLHRLADVANSCYSTLTRPRYEYEACTQREKPRWYRWAWEAEIVDEMLMDLDTQIHFSFYGFYPLFTEEAELLPAYQKYEDTCLEIERQALSLSSRQRVGNEVRLIEVERVMLQLQQLEERIEKEQQTL
jgi:hypothetical protein